MVHIGVRQDEPEDLRNSNCVAIVNWIGVVVAHSKIAGYSAGGPHCFAKACFLCGLFISIADVNHRYVTA